MTRNAAVDRLTSGAAGLERIRHLEEQLARAPVDSREHRTLTAAIAIEAGAYRKSLDAEQAARPHITEITENRRPAVGR